MLPRILGVAVVCLTLTALGASAGGGKKDTKKAAVGAIEVFKTDAGKWRYRVKDAEGKTIAMPLPNMTWDSKADCLKGIDELRTILNKAAPVEVKQQSAKGEAK